jgi:hypothetical protein
LDSTTSATAQATSAATLYGPAEPWQCT